METLGRRAEWTAGSASSCFEDVGGRLELRNRASGLGIIVRRSFSRVILRFGGVASCFIDIARECLSEEWKGRWDELPCVSGMSEHPLHFEFE